MKQWIKVLLIALVVLTVSEVFGQGCAQCKHEMEQSSVENDTIGIAENADVKRALLFYYVGIPVAVVTAVLIIIFRKKIASGLHVLFKREGRKG